MITVYLFVVWCMVGLGYANDEHNSRGPVGIVGKTRQTGVRTHVATLLRRGQATSKGSSSTKPPPDKRKPGGSSQGSSRGNSPDGRSAVLRDFGKLSLGSPAKAEITQDKSDHSPNKSSAGSKLRSGKTPSKRPKMEDHLGISKGRSSRTHITKPRQWFKEYNRLDEGQQTERMKDLPGAAKGELHLQGKHAFGDKESPSVSRKPAFGLDKIKHSKSITMSARISSLAHNTPAPQFAKLDATANKITTTITARKKSQWDSSPPSSRDGGSGSTGGTFMKVPPGPFGGFRKPIYVAPGDTHTHTVSNGGKSWPVTVSAQTDSPGEITMKAEN